METISWIGLDWGTTNLRAFAVDANGTILDERTSEDGMGKLSNHEFEPALVKLISPWLKDSDMPLPLFACGMVGAKQGWVEAQYREVPCHPVSSAEFTMVPTNDKRLKMHILPGLSQRRPPDVMRGEETQIAGLILQKPNFTGAVCLPGTHSKWVLVEEGVIKKFTTFMTGELFDILSKQSVLRHTVTSDDWDGNAFSQAVDEARAEPLSVMEILFGLRANSLLEGVSNGTCRARLSGLLIGQEIGLAKKYWSDKSVSLIGSPDTVPHYQGALKQVGVDVEEIDTRLATIAGLRSVAQQSLQAMAST